MASNPNPALITDAMWWLAGQLLALEPGTQLGGIYANKSGYHNTGNANEARWPGDYSIRDAEDRRGLNWRTKSAALDWTFPEAQRGDYRRMAKYGARLRAGFDARDPRLAGWREALGQTDTDAPPEGMDFRRWFTRVPDDTHRWHWHFSEDREQVESLANKRALLSVLRGETLAQWQMSQGSAGPGPVSGGDDDMYAIPPTDLPTGPRAHRNYCIPPVNSGAVPWGPAWLSVWADLFGGKAVFRLAIGDGATFTSIKERVVVESGKLFNLALPTGTRGLSFLRLPADDKDTCLASVSFTVEYARR